MEGTTAPPPDNVVPFGVRAPLTPPVSRENGGVSPALTPNEPEPQPAPVLTTDRFLAVIGPRRAPKRVTEDDAFLAMMWRQARALERRAIDNPELLTQCVAFAQRVSEITNVAIYANAERYHTDPHSGASMAECARAMGISVPSASARKKIGERVMNERIEAAGAVKFSEAQREKAARDAAAEHAVTSLSEYRARHARSA